jgi:hypothetical protein
MLVELETCPPFWGKVVEALFDAGILRKTEKDERVVYQNRVIPNHVVTSLDAREPDLCVTTVEIAKARDLPFLSNGLPIESNIEAISRESIGHCEDRKGWAKDVRAAAKNYGHDEVLTAFYFWSQAQNGFVGAKPVAAFLRNISQNIGLTAAKPRVTNPALERVLSEIAYRTDNKVFFQGNYKVLLAAFIKDNGESLVLEAFDEFYEQASQEKTQAFAAKNFIEQAPLIITTIKRRKMERDQQEAKVKSAYQQAQSMVQDDEEPEIEAGL